MNANNEIVKSQRITITIVDTLPAGGAAGPGRRAMLSAEGFSSPLEVIGALEMAKDAILSSLGSADANFNEVAIQ